MLFIYSQMVQHFLITDVSSKEFLLAALLT